ncbi:MAG: UDP-N-acetylmuramoyl-tripeptide--D-alanyl-D-alanine ligase [Bacteroidota bacterium]
MELTQLYQTFLDSTGVSTDTRSLKADQLFFALRGDNFDGNRFAEKALQKRAKFVIGDNADYADLNGFILVEDSLQTLQNLARYHRQQFVDIPVFALTGSNGKTTSKELLIQVLATQFRVHATRGNFNNHIGVPLTLLELKGDTEIAIIEMGANHQEEIAALCRIAEPTHGAITNIGTAHLEGFGGQMGILKGKTELYDFLDETGGQIFAPAYDGLLQTKMKSYQNPIFWEFQAPIQTEPQLIYADESGNAVTTHLFGRFNFYNVLLALAVGKYFGISPENAHRAISNYVPTNNRSQTIQRGEQTFLLDAYNANPASMKVALRSFAHRKAAYRVVILGDMLELGDYEDQKHQEIYQLAQELDFERVIFCGERFGRVVDASDECYPDFDALQKGLSENPLSSNALILLKGSRGMRLERLLQIQN